MGLEISQNRKTAFAFVRGSIDPSIITAISRRLGGSCHIRPRYVRFSSAVERREYVIFVVSVRFLLCLNMNYGGICLFGL